jgi:cytochrome oxidase Cu insertion factor (SCO1/SenC/PrrC family)
MLKALVIAALVGGVWATMTDDKAAKDDKSDSATAKSVYDFTVKDIDGKDVRLTKYKGDVLMIVNVASL